MKHKHLPPLAAAAALALWASAAAAIDLLGAYGRAQQADPAKRAADHALTAGREKAVQGDALLLPRINLSGGVTRQEDRSSSAGAALPPPLDQLARTDASGNAREVGLTLTQPIYDARAWADRKQLHAQTRIAQAQHHDAQQDLMLRVGEAYFGVLLAEESLRVVLAEKAAVQLQRDRAQARLEVGRGRITDMQEAQARVDSVATREVSARSTLALRQAQFQELTGEPGQGLAPLKAGFAPQPPLPDNLADWQRVGEAGNTRVALRQQELEIASAEIGKHTLAGRPALELVTRYTQREQSSGLSSAFSPDSRRNALIGLQLTVPLFAGGALDSRQRESVARRSEADEQLAAARRDARLQVQDGFLAVKTGVSRIASLEQSLTSARTALEATTLGRDVGTRTELDVLDAQQRVFQVQLELAQARNDYLLGRIRLAAAAGAMHEDELRNLNGYLAL
jgi:outer membrane protein